MTNLSSYLSHISGFVNVFPSQLHLKKICPLSFRETCQWLKCPLKGLRAQSRVSPGVGLLPLASGPACLGMEFPPFQMKQLYCSDSVVISSSVRTEYTARRWWWLLGSQSLATSFDVKCTSSSGHYKRTRLHTETKYSEEGELPFYIRNTFKMCLPLGTYS